MKIVYRRLLERPGIAQILVDGELWREVSSLLFGRRSPFPKQVEPEAWETLFLEIERKRGIEYALRSLARKEQPSFELAERLVKKGIDPHNVEAIVQQCISWGFVDDARWLDLFVQGQIARKKGPRAIVMELLRKGVEKETAAQAVARLAPEERQMEGIKALLEGRYKKYDLNDRKQRQKLIHALLRKGYSFELVLASLKV